MPTPDFDPRRPDFGIFVSRWRPDGEPGRGADQARHPPRRARVRVYTQIFGPGNKETLTPRVVLAVTYWEMGRVVEAIPILEQVAADSERVLGPDHMDTLSARAYLALSYLESGRVDEAVALFERIEPERGHPDVPHSELDRLDLAPLYAAAGRTQDAIAAAKWGVADSERVIGPDDPITVAARAFLAGLIKT